MNLKNYAESVNNHINRNNYLYTLLLIIGLAEVLINPIGEFTLNDDWAYAKMVKNYVLDNRIYSPNAGGSIFIFQLYIGAFASKIFGFSLTLLRFIGIIIGGLGIIAMHQILMQMTNSKKFAIIGSLLFGMNPIYLNGSNSFHTDVPTTFFMLLSFYWFIKYFKTRTINSYALGVIFSIIACAIKQTSVSIGIAFSIFYIIGTKKTIRNIIIGILPFTLMGSFIFIYFYAVTYFNLDWPGAYFSRTYNWSTLQKLLNPDYATFKQMSYHLITTTLSLGIFVSPIALPYTFKAFYSREIKLFNYVLLTFALLLIILILGIKIYLRSKQGVMGGGIWYMPFVGYNIYDFGIGPLYNTGISPNEIPGVFVAGIAFWFIVSIIGAISFISFLNIIILTKNNCFTPLVLSGKMIFPPFFPFMIMLISFIPYLFLYPHAKYLTLYFPFMIITIISALNIISEKNYYCFKISIKTLISCTFPIVMFGVIGTRDYMSFNRVKWDALSFLIEKEKIPVEKIDGGFEFNEWHLSHQNILVMTDDSSKKGRFWPVVDDEYIVTVTEIEGYDVYKEFKYRRWLPPRKHSINVLKRTTRQKNL